MLKYKTNFNPRKDFETYDEVCETYDKQKRKRIKFQVITFVISYFIWVVIHTQREFWSISKKSIDKVKIPGLDINFFGTLDFVMYLCYSLA